MSIMVQRAIFYLGGAALTIRVFTVKEGRLAGIRPSQSANSRSGLIRWIRMFRSLLAKITPKHHRKVYNVFHLMKPNRFGVTVLGIKKKSNQRTSISTKKLHETPIVLPDRNRRISKCRIASQFCDNESPSIT